MAGEGQPLVTAVIVNWRSAADTARLLESLGEAVREGLRFVVVENGSGDDSATRLRAFIEQWECGAAVTFIESVENAGFTGGVNLGTARALSAETPPEYIWLLNPDAKVAPAAMREIVAVAAESGAGIVGAIRSEMHVHARAWPRLFFLPRRWWMTAAGSGARWCEGGIYWGWCALFRASLVRELVARDGFFQDPSLFMDWDELNCTLRARRLGSQIALSKRAEVMHDGSPRALGVTAIAAARQYYQSRNMVAIARQFMPAWQFWALLPVHVARDLSWFLRLRARGLRPNEKAYLLGLLDGLRGRMGRWKHHPASR